MRYLLAAIVVLTGSISAQDVTSQAKAEFEKLSNEFEAAQKIYQAERKTIIASDEFKKAREANDRDARRKLMSKAKRPDRGAYAERFMAAANEYVGKEEAVPFLSWAILNGGREWAKKGTTKLIQGHASSAKLGDFMERAASIGRLIGADEAREAMTKIIKENPDKNIQASAYLARAGMFRGKELTDTQKEQKAADLAMVVKLAPDSIMAMRAEAPAFKKNRLQIGMVAPDIEGTDFNGTKFKTSDYRGKVVVLDFWGDW